MKKNTTPPQSEITNHVPQKKKVALALQGGGSHGSFTWGVIDALLEDGRFEVEGLCGTSAGAMNSLATAQGLIKGGLEGGRQQLKEYWDLIIEAAVTSPFKPGFFDQLMGNYGLSRSPGYILMSVLQSFLSPYDMNPLGINPLKDVVSKVFDFNLLNNAQTPKVFLCATHVKSGKTAVFKTGSSALESVLASACLPTLFQAVEVDGEFYWDGGYSANPAIYPLVDGCETADIIVVQLTPVHRAKLPTKASEIMDRHDEITFNACLMREMRAIAMITKWIDLGVIAPGTKKRLNMHMIRNETELRKHEFSSTLNVSKEFTYYLFEQGRKTAKSWISENFDKVGNESSFDIKKFYDIENQL